MNHQCCKYKYLKFCLRLAIYEYFYVTKRLIIINRLKRGGSLFGPSNFNRKQPI